MFVSKWRNKKTCHQRIFHWDKYDIFSIDKCEEAPGIPSRDIEASTNTLFLCRHTCHSGPWLSTRPQSTFSYKISLLLGSSLVSMRVYTAQKTNLSWKGNISLSLSLCCDFPPFCVDPFPVECHLCPIGALLDRFLWRWQERQANWSWTLHNPVNISTLNYISLSFWQHRALLLVSRSY